MSAYNQHQLGFPEKKLRSISNHMIDVRAIISYTFINSRDQRLGLMSIDISAREVVFDNRNAIIETRPTETSPAQTITIDFDQLELMSRTIGNVLESFDIARRRMSYD